MYILYLMVHTIFLLLIDHFPVNYKLSILHVSRNQKALRYQWGLVVHIFLLIPHPITFKLYIIRL